MLVKPRLLVAEHEPTRMGIRLAVADVAAVVAEAGTALEAIRSAERVQPDICIVGLEIAGSGPAAVRAICAAAPEVRVVALAPGLGTGELLALLRAGAIGFLPLTVAPVALRRVVLAVARDEAAIPRERVMDLVRELQSVVRLNGMSSLEADILRMLRGGESTTAIAAGLAISPVTVRRHISEIVRKTGVADRAGLIDTGGRSASLSGAIAAD